MRTPSPRFVDDPTAIHLSIWKVLNDVCFLKEDKVVLQPVSYQEGFDPTPEEAAQAVDINGENFDALRRSPPALVGWSACSAGGGDGIPSSVETQLTAM